MSTAKVDEPDYLGVRQPVPSQAWYVADRIVERYTEWLGRDRIRAWVPCHDEHSVTVAAPRYGYPPEEHLVRCQARGCELAFLLSFYSGGGEDDWTAVWKVSPWVRVLHTTTRHGSARW